MDNSGMIRLMKPWVFFCGILAIVFYVLHDIIGAMYYPGYNRSMQAVSDLTATDAPSFAVAGGLSSCYGICSCLCCAFLCVMVKDTGRSFRTGIYLFTAMNIISAAGYSLFPLASSGYDGSFQSFIHVYIITVLVVILSVFSLIMISAGSFRDGRKMLGILAAFSLLCMIAGAAGSAIVPKEFFGIAERFSTYSAVFFTGILGVYGYKKADSALKYGEKIKCHTKE